MADGLSCRIEAPAAFAAGQPVRLRFLLHNGGTQAVQVLAWGTPLEPPGFARWAELRRDGQLLAYRGATVKRGEPEAADYRRLAAGQTLEAAFELAPAWDTAPSGRYELRPRLVLHDVAPAGAALPRPRAAHQGRELPCAPLVFEVRR